ncbi:MAG: NHLP family bacteriocin export ABC transporter peptidase/permease/ATPase subunit [Candidatus Improbicoccus devescovinae]|nr:MAG: NHLP family bacteriocin export ABC transporter peptidase/permease/ATPase subunit [Candidatus Improbicoccus devescovinae]
MKKIKVPVIMQMEALECGAACLCMIAAYYKKWIPLSQVRKDCGVSRDGSVAKNILNAGRAYGFEAAGYRLEPSDFSDVKFPAIIHWDFNHFVVLTSIDYNKKCVYINDPGRGRVVLTMEEFDRSFTGILLSFEPTEDFKPEGKPKSIWEFAKRCLKGSMTPFIISIILSFISSIIMLFSPIFDRVFIDNILSGKEPGWLNAFIGITVILMIINILIGVVKFIYWLKIEGKFSIVSSSKFIWHALRMPLDFFSQRYVGDIVERQNSTGQIALVLIKKIAPMFIDTISLVFYLYMMINYSWLLTCIGITASVLNMIIVNFSSKRISEFQQAAAGNSGKLMSVTYSAIEMIETIKSTGAENGFFERWSGFYAKQNNDSIKVLKFIKYFGEIPVVISGIAQIALQISGVVLIIKDQFTIGMLTAFTGFLSGFFEPISKFLDVYQSFISIKTEMDRVEDVLDHPIDPMVDIIETTEDIELIMTGKLELRNVTFGYSRLAPPLISDFSLILKPGKSIALVGGSGSGKSTISKLIMGLYIQWDGEILFDGLPRSKIDRYIFHSSVSMVDQEKIMFNDSIKNNIKVWDESIEDFSMILAARDANIHDVIIKRPEGYDQIMREGGKDFSGGQCQRLEIARALATEPRLLILDEATSALDAKTENIVMENIKNLGCSLVVVAHRLSTIRDCDEIIVLNQGKVVERGTHEELIDLNNLYTKLVTNE